FSPAADIDQLQGWIGMKSTVDSLAPFDRNAPKFHACITPLLFIGERIADYASKAYPRQAVACLSSTFGILCNQNKLPGRINDDRRPACEISCETDLNGAAYMKSGKLFRGSCVQYKRAAT